MDRTEVMNMLKSELEGKLDQDTINRLKEAKSSKEALSILEGASIELNDDMLAAVAGGGENEWGMPLGECEFYHQEDPTATPCRSFWMIS